MQYVLWNNKIHSYKCNLLPFVATIATCKGTYYMPLNGIHTSCLTEVIGSYIWKSVKLAIVNSV